MSDLEHISNVARVHATWCNAMDGEDKAKCVSLRSQHSPPNKALSNFIRRATPSFGPFIKLSAVIWPNDDSTWDISILCSACCLAIGVPNVQFGRRISSALFSHGAVYSAQTIYNPWSVIKLEFAVTCDRPSGGHSINHFVFPRVFESSSCLKRRCRCENEEEEKYPMSLQKAVIELKPMWL